MARFSAGAKTTNGGTDNALPAIAIHAPAGSGFVVREIGLFNTTATACDFMVARLTTAGTPGSAITVDKQDPSSAAAVAVPCQSYSSTPPTNADLGYRCSLGAAVGSGTIFTFGGDGLRVPAGTGNGIALIPRGTGQIIEAYFVWDE